MDKKTKETIDKFSKWSEILSIEDCKGKDKIQCVITFKKRLCFNYSNVIFV